MAKIAKKYLKVHSDIIIEEGYSKERHQVSESLFSLSNEYMGVRAYFDEDISDTKSLRAVYYNGIYDYSRETLNTGYKGIATRTHFMVNAHDIFGIRLLVNGQKLDLAKVNFSNFSRELSLKSGLYERSFVWHINTELHVKVSIKRLLSMNNPHLALQSITLTATEDAEVLLTFITDNKLKQWGGDSYFKTHSFNRKDHVLVSETLFTKQKVYTKSDFKTSLSRSDYRLTNRKEVETTFKFNLLKDVPVNFERYVTNIHSREHFSYSKALNALYQEAATYYKKPFTYYVEENTKFYERLNEISQIDIKGNDEDLQGVRYSIFMLNSTYHGYSPHNNLGAKGLTGEAYSGHAFWDSETYCFAYYLFNNPKAAKDLLLFRFNQLDAAKKRAIELDCRGACYPIATLNGEEGCTLWQHASLQLQPTTAVNYAFYHYYNVTKDKKFMKKYGLPLLKETIRFLLDRGQYDSSGKVFGYYGVMGPDEFKMMVNHNAYTNIMAKFSFDFLLSLLEEYKNDSDYDTLIQKHDFNEEFLNEVKEKSSKMALMFNEDTLLYEQNEGFFSLPHIDIHAIPDHEFPLYSNWTYDRIYRGNMIKQPDVLMFLFLFNTHFSKEVKKANYDYYEPKTIHESSLSPSIHSIFASELDYDEEALDFFAYASRLDLDDYNNNTNEGLHLTSMAATWMNIVYGFGGFRSDGAKYRLAPKLPARWQGYSFRLNLGESLIKVEVSKEKLKVTLTGKPISLFIYDKEIHLGTTYEKYFNQE